MEEREIFNRTERLFGEALMEKFHNTRVIIFGVGGVGSWCAEGLIRSGIGHLTIIDPDRVCVTNINRQLMATVKTAGQVKVEALKERLLEINPHAEINAIRSYFSDETAESFSLDSYDYIIDAVDSLKNKAQLILRACQSRAVFFSSMGAAVKVDPTKIKVAEFWNVRGCPLGAALRKKFNQAETFPSHKFLCVYDDEVLPNRGVSCTGDCDSCGLCPTGEAPAKISSKAVINGTSAHITAIFGFTLSGLVLKDLYKKY